MHRFETTEVNSLLFGKIIKIISAHLRRKYNIFVDVVFLERKILLLIHG